MSSYKLKFLGLLVLVIALTVNLSACFDGGANDFETYTLTIGVIGGGSGGGSTRPEPGTHGFEEGVVVDIEAFEIDPEDDAKHFIEWEGDVAEKYSAETIVIMDEDKTVTAIFDYYNGEADKYYTITLDIVGEGIVHIVDGGYDYKEGEEVELTATADEGHEFLEWTGYKDSTESTLNFNMPAENIEITAVFTEETSSAYTDNYLGLYNGLELESEGESETIFYD